MKRCAIWLVCLTLAFVSTSRAAALRIITEDAPPLNYFEDGKPTGFAVDVVTEIEKRLGLKTPIEIMPWSKGYDLALKGPDIMLFSTTRADWREKLFQWVGPVTVHRWVFVAKTERDFPMAGLEDAKKARAIATYRDDSKEQYLKSHGFTNLDSSTTEQACLNKLMAGRVDLWIVDEANYFVQAHQAGVDPQKELKVVYNVVEMPLYLAFSKDVPAEVVAAWQKALDDMKKDGTFATIQNKWKTKLQEGSAH